MSQPGASPARAADRSSRGERGLVALVVGLAGLTAITGWLPELRFAALAPELDLLINGVLALIAAGAAWLGWLRYRHMADVSALYQAAAFLIFTFSAGIQTAANLGIGETALGLSLDAPGQAPVYVWSFHRLVAGSLLLRSAWLRARPAPSRQRPETAIGAILGLTLAISVALYAAEPVLPPLLNAEALERIAAAGDFLGPLPGITVLELVIQAIAVALLGGAALGYALAARRGGGAPAIYLAAGLVVASFAQVHFALFPGVYTNLVTSSDLLRIGFYVFVLFGIQADAGATLRELRHANRQLHELRDVELARASLAERARLAREVHDGLAQSLWLAKMATERLAQARKPNEIEDVRRELTSLLDAGIDEARQTVVALRDAGRPETSLADGLTRHVRRFEQETGLSVRLDVEGLAGRAVPVRLGGELLRIAQEALNNVRKHADATVVVIDLEGDGTRVRLSIRDNGVGFDPGASRTGFGLDSMRERAEEMGGRLTVDSSASGGTTVVAELPVVS